MNRWTHWSLKRKFFIIFLILSLLAWIMYFKTSLEFSSSWTLSRAENFSDILSKLDVSQRIKQGSWLLKWLLLWVIFMSKKLFTEILNQRMSYLTEMAIFFSLTLVLLLKLIKTSSQTVFVVQPNICHLRCWRIQDMIILSIGGP